MEGNGDKKENHIKWHVIFNAQNLILKSTIVRTVQRFIKTGNVKDRSWMTHICFQ